MKLVVEFKYVSMIHKPIITSDWTKYELDIEKIGLFNKPKLDVRNLSIKVIKQLKDTLICTINNELVTNRLALVYFKCSKDFSFKFR